MPVVQIASAQPSTSVEDLLGARVGGEVEVVAEPAEQRVAHRTTDQVQLVTRRGEPLAEFVGDGETRSSSATARRALALSGECLGHGRVNLSGRPVAAPPVGCCIGGSTL